MKYGIFSANEFLFTDSNPKNGKTNIKLYAPQNSFANVQILIETNSTLTFEFCNDNTLPCPQIYKLIPVYVDKNTGVGSNCVVPQGTQLDYPSRLAPFYIYDAMEPIESSVSPQKEGLTAIYLRWPTFSLNKGYYNGSFNISDSDGNSVNIPVEINIANAKIPQIETLRLTNWFDIKNLPEYHSCSLWSEEHWELIKQYGLLMRETHQTDFWLPKELFTYTKNSNGEFIFDLGKAERLIKLYLSLGFRYIEGPIMLYRKAWDKGEFYIKIDGEDVNALSDEAYPFMQAFYTQLYNCLKAHGWFEIFNGHVGDEPCKYCINEYRILSGMIRKWMPAVKIIEAVETPDLNGAVDIWVPKSVIYEEHKEAFDKKPLHGDTLWFYTCCFPGGFYLNRLLDQELIRTRYLHWANYIYGFTGYLHWGLNIYHANGGNDVFTHSSNRVDKIVAQVLPAGDTHILYPVGNQIFRSVRFEMMRSGCEDYELLQQLSLKDKKKADEIAKICVRTFTDYTKDIEIFEETYRLLLEQF